MKNFTNLFVSIFFIGYIKFVPGTWGSFVALFIMYYLCNILSMSLPVLLVIFIILFFLSNYFINVYSSFTKSQDSSHIVIDEFLGVFLIFLFYDLIKIHNDFVTCALIFIIFRIFDISKIFPSSYFDKKIKNGFGVILDDLVAGLYTVLTMVIINAFI